MERGLTSGLQGTSAGEGCWERLHRLLPLAAKLVCLKRLSDGQEDGEEEDDEGNAAAAADDDDDEEEEDDDEEEAKSDEEEAEEADELLNGREEDIMEVSRTSISGCMKGGATDTSADED